MQVTKENCACVNGIQVFLSLLLTLHRAGVPVIPSRIIDALFLQSLLYTYLVQLQGAFPQHLDDSSGVLLTWKFLPLWLNLKPRDETGILHVSKFCKLAADTFDYVTIIIEWPGKMAKLSQVSG